MTQVLPIVLRYCHFLNMIMDVADIEMHVFISTWRHPFDIDAWSGA